MSRHAAAVAGVCSESMRWALSSASARATSWGEQSWYRTSAAAAGSSVTVPSSPARIPSTRALASVGSTAVTDATHDSPTSRTIAAT